MDGVVELHAIVKGNVQGVGFRATTRHYAQELGLKGSVKNLSDGTVEVYAQGNKDNLEKLVEKLKGHDGLGNVSDAIVDFSDPTRDFDSFDILF